MGLFLVPATEENIMISIENPVPMDFIKKHLPGKFINEIIQLSGLEGFRCWAMTKNKNNEFNSMKVGDDVLFTVRNTGLFTHYGQVVGKINNKDFGINLWPYSGKYPWENIYFLRNIKQINIPKKNLVIKLGFSDKFNVPGPAHVSQENLREFESNNDIITNYAGLEVESLSEEKEIETIIPKIKNFKSKNIESKTQRREGQALFAKVVKTIYNNSCAFCGITEPEFLIAGTYYPMG